MTNLINFLMSNETHLLISFIISVFFISMMYLISWWLNKESKRIEKIELNKCRQEICELKAYITLLRSNKEKNKYE